MCVCSRAHSFNGKEHIIPKHSSVIYLQINSLNDILVSYIIPALCVLYFRVRTYLSFDVWCLPTVMKRIQSKITFLSPKLRVVAKLLVRRKVRDAYTSVNML